ncbi:phosphomannomutase [Paracoccus aerodenitrificans]|uniref:phosphomannomutase n=1 Tax=Paracoccus aerodenitrificans TaxID=3017781 RepID=UPI0022F05464|nr:phosphomannomutase [Paracoccus aerodenitrificans]WBU65310.1 phosphomannomutase [Paracoccus aerodenitrificans]
MAALSCFKAYDIRGRLGENLDADIAFRIGRGFARALGAKRVVLGRDIRASSVELADAVADALIAEGVEVLDLGLCGTEEMYFATTHFDADGGIEVTASHNPMDYNGMKMVRAGSAPLDGATGLDAIRKLAEADDFRAALPGGSRRDVSFEARAAYVARVLEFVDVTALRPLKIVVNAGNGAAGPTFDAIADELAQLGAPLEFIRIHHQPDSSFPNGIPNPLLPENQPVTANAVREAGADLGIAWDGDFDRCFFFDETGSFIDGEYIVGLLAAAFLAREPGARIVHDPRIIWNTRDIVESTGGTAIQSRTGHAFLKAALREHDAVYGGEMSAHHYFRDFVFCDSGMIPWLLVTELMGRAKKPLSDLVADRRAAFPSSGEINFVVADPDAARARVEEIFGAEAQGRDETDGLSLDMGTWRFNLRSSQTEPVLRLNAESRGDRDLLDRSVAKLRRLIDEGESFGG